MPLTKYANILPTITTLMLLVGGRKGIRPVKNWVMGCWRGCLGWGADLQIAQQMPLPLTISCSSKSRLVLPFLVLSFWYLLIRVVLDRFQKNSKTIVCVCVQFINNWKTQGRFTNKLRAFHSQVSQFCNTFLSISYFAHISYSIINFLIFRQQ